MWSAGALALMVVCGERSPIPLWPALQELPLYQSLRVPSRALMGVVYSLTLAAGFGVDGMIARWPRAVRVMPWLTAWIGLELLVQSWRLFGSVFIIPAITLPAETEFATRFRACPFHWPAMTSCQMPVLRSGSGILEGYENIAVSRGKVRVAGEPGYRGEAWLSSGGGIEITKRTMRTVTVTFTAPAEDRLRLNQNWYIGWRADVTDADGVTRSQRAERSPEGLVSVPVNPSDRRVRFHYLPDSFLIGLVISGVTVAGLSGGLAATWLVRRRRSADAVVGHG